MKDPHTTHEPQDACLPEPHKRPYSAPELKEHGSVEDVTLQTFFGSFSP